MRQKVGGSCAQGLAPPAAAPCTMHIGKDSGVYQTGQRMLSSTPNTSCAYHVFPRMCCPRRGG